MTTAAGLPLPDPIHPWEEGGTFTELMSRVVGHTLVDPVRCFMLYQYARHSAALPGDVAEIGVYRGGTARLLSGAMKGAKTIHLFDTFAGMPPTDPARDIHRQGDFADTSLAHVQGYLGDCPGLVFHPGYFPATATPVRERRFCFVHVDVDIYQSVLDCCAFFYPRMTPGGVMLFDDYGFRSCPGAKLAVDEFFAATPERPCYLPTGQCVVVRLGAPDARPWAERPLRVMEAGAKTLLRAVGGRSFLRRAVKTVLAPGAPAAPVPSDVPAPARLAGEHLDRYVHSVPTAQNAVDIFSGEWSSKLPDRLAVRAGAFLLFEDTRLRWALGVIGGAEGKAVLELGPLEAGHTYMLEEVGARRVTAIEANVRAFLKCLVVKEVAKLERADFLCGDFVEFLKSPHPRYDVVLACGVLYHMREPIRFLEMLAETAPAIVMFTHYYDEARIRANPRTVELFTDAVEMSAGGFSCTVRRQNYPEVASASLGFSGGSATHSYWMQKADILAALRHFGYTRIETNHDDPDHANGPGFSVVACRD